MDFNEYQKEAYKTATYPDLGNNIIYPALGLAGESGELVDKIKKFWRNNFDVSHTTEVWEIKDALPENQRLEIVKELGDILWYISAMATELEVDLSEVARVNLEKLFDRRDRGVIKSEGDNR